MADIQIARKNGNPNKGRVRRSIVEICGGNVRRGMLTIIGETEQLKKDGTMQRLAICVCDCGKTVNRHPSSILRSDNCNCGCNRDYRIGNTKKHGDSRKLEYGIWSGMKDRCKPNHPKYNENYYGRGIRVCERWMKYENFISDMGYRPSLQHSLDRIDVNGNYEPSNCRWATHVEQAHNRRSTVWVQIGNKRMPVSNLCEKAGLSQRYVSKRTKDGYSGERIIRDTIEALESLLKN